MTKFESLVLAIGNSKTPRPFFNVIHDHTSLVGHQLHAELVETKPDLMRWCKCAMVSYK